MELVWVFKRARKMHPIIPLGKHALNMLQKIRKWCTSKHCISFTRKKCDSFTNENLSEKREFECEFDPWQTSMGRERRGNEGKGFRFWNSAMRKYV
jgi:hypothetical protein